MPPHGQLPQAHSRPGACYDVLSSLLSSLCLLASMMQGSTWQQAWCDPRAQSYALSAHLHVCSMSMSFLLDALHSYEA